MSSTNASSSTSSRSSNGVTMAVMTDPMPGTGAIIPHVVEVEARDDVRVVVRRRPVAASIAALRAGGAAHLAALRRRVPAMHDGPVLAMTAVDGGVVRARRAGYFDMVATADALAGDPALRARAAALAGDDPLHRGDGRVAADRAVGRGDGARRRRAARAPARRPAARPGALARRALGHARARAGPDHGAAVAREAREELGVDVDPGARCARSGWAGTSRACAPRCASRSRCDAVPAPAGGDEFDAVEAFEPARPPTRADARRARARWRCSGSNARRAGRTMRRA